jgi:metal-responsive CopG/Arc/MetJ family transcriptional regulator
VATRQTSSSGKSKSPRVQVVLPEELCARLASLAERESRTVSNMAKVLIQQGVQRYEQGQETAPSAAASLETTEGFRSALEAQQPRRLRGAPRRIRLQRPS